MASLNVPYISPEQAAASIQESRNDFPQGLTSYHVTHGYLHHPMPARHRVTQYGAPIWTPDVAPASCTLEENFHCPYKDTDTSFRAGYAADNLVAMMRNPEPWVVRNIGTVSGFKQATWDGLNIPVPADGLMQMLMYFSGEATAIRVKLTDDSSGDIQYEYRNSTVLGKCQNTLQLWNPATDANYLFSDQLLSSDGSSDLNPNTNIVVTDNSFDFTGNITKIQIILVNSGLNDEVILDGLYTQTKIKPMIGFLFDVSNNDVFTNFQPVWDANKWKATFRLGGTAANWSSYDAGLESAYDVGHSVSNGTLSREGTLDTTTDADLIRRELMLSCGRIKARGFSNPILVHSAGNSVPDIDNRRTICGESGIRWMKSGDQMYEAGVVGANGFDEPLNLPVHTARSYQDMINHIAGIKYVGGFIFYYPHQCPTGGDLTTWSTASSSSVWKEAIDALAVDLLAEETAGNLDVVDITQFDLIMRGLL